MNDWRNAFLTDLQGRAARKTYDGYRRATERFHSYISIHSWTIDGLNKAALDGFVASLHREGLAANTVHTYHTLANQYLTWCRARGAQVPEQARARLPRITKSIPYVLRDRTLAAYFEVARTVPSPYAALMLLMPVTGIRVAAMCGLQVHDLEIKPPAVRFLLRPETNPGIKYGKGRKVWMLPAGKQFLFDYLKHQRPALPGADSVWMFPTRSGRRALPSKVQRHMRAVRAELGIEGLTPHTLRKTYATMCHEHGLLLPDISLLLGHADPKTTMRYIAGSDESRLDRMINQEPQR